MSYLRKGFVLVLVFVLTIMSVQSLFAYPRTVLNEYFTSNNCGYCVAQHEPLTNMLTTFTRDQVVLVTYHIYIGTANDPYCLINPTENNGRFSYYGLTGVPSNRIDGTNNTLPTSGSFTSTISSRSAQDVPYDIDVETSLSGDDIVADIAVTFDDGSLDNMRLFGVLCEEVGDINPGSNGISDYRYNMLDMMPTHNGQTVTATAGETLNFQWTFDTHGWETGITNLSVVCFLQNYTTKEVYQAGIGPIIADTPFVTYESHFLDDLDQTYPNNRLDPGESATLTVTLYNTPEFLMTDNLVGTLTCDNENVVIDDGDGSWSDIYPGTQAVNSDDPFTISLPETFDADYVTYTLTLSDDSGYETSIEFTQLTGLPEILFINDHGTSADQSETWMEIFTAADEVAEFYAPATAATYDLSIYPTIIWSTGGARDDVISESEMTLIENYLDGGGKLILTGEHIGPDLDDDAEWFAQYFGAEHHLDSAPSGATSFHVDGVEEGLLPEAEFWLMYGAGNNTSPSTVRTAGENSQYVYMYYGSPLYASVINITDTFSSIYLGFNLEAVATDGVDETQPAHEVLNDLLGILYESSDVETPVETLLPSKIEVSAYPNPFNASVKIGFNLPQTEKVKVDVFNTLGRQVASLYNGSTIAGYHEVNWNAAGMSSGIYLVRVSTKTENHLQKVMLVK